MTMGHESDDHNRWCYKIRLVKKGYITTQTKPTNDNHPIPTEKYLRNGVVKGNKQQTNDKLSKFIYIFAKIHNDVQ